MAKILLSQPPASKLEFDNFTKQTGLKLPDDLKAVYEYSNGFDICNSDFIFDGDIYYISHWESLSVTGSDVGMGSLYIILAQEDEFISHCHLPFGSAAGGTDVFAYSVCQESFGAIYLYSMDDFPDGDYVFKLFDSLAEFMNAIGLIIPA